MVLVGIYGYFQLISHPQITKLIIILSFTYAFSWVVKGGIISFTSLRSAPSAEKQPLRHSHKRY